MRSHDWPRSPLVELANVLESMADGFIALDSDFRITFVNAAAERAYGVTRESAIGRTYSEALSAALGTAIERELIRAMAERVPIRGLRSQEPGGRWFEVDVHPVQNGGLALHCRDITERKRADEALHKSEERFRRHFELGLVGMAITSPTKGWLEVNDEICRILGYDRGELLQMSWAELTHPDDLAADVAQFNRVMAGELDGYVMDKRFLRKDGQIVYSIISAKVVRREDGSVDYSVGLLHDISERKLAEEKLKTSESLLAEAQQIAHLGSWSWDIRTDVVTWSDECFRLFGLMPQEGGMNYERGVDHVHPDDREMLRSKVEQALIDHQPFECHCRALQQDGTVRFAQTRGRVVLNEQGEPVRMFGILQDITERKQAEEARLESERRLAAELFGMARLQKLSTRLIQAGDSSALLQEVVDAAIAITAADRGNVHLLDDGSDTLVIAASRGFEPPFLDFFSTVQEGQGACGTAIQERARVVIDDVTSSPVLAGKPALEVVLTSGVRAVQSTPLISRSGRVVGVLSTHWNRPHEPAARELRLLDLLARQASDLIERHLAQAERDSLLESERQARAEAERQARLKDEFLATLSHELRTPLGAIVGWTGLVREQVTDPQIVLSGIEVIARSARAQTQLIEDILDLSGIVTGKMRLNIERVALPVVVAAAIEAVRPSAEAKGIRIHHVIEPITEPVHGDAARLQQIAWNLLSNAVKFTREGGGVQVVLARVNSQVELRVSDTGSGIHPSFLPHVFKRFRQADASLTREHGGLGIGLALVKEFTELHGGTVRAASDGEGKGSTFVVKLPLAILHASDDEPEEHPRVSPSSPPPLDPGVPELQGLRVLVVEDDPDSLRIMQWILERRRAQVATARSVTDALVALENDTYDVLLSDIGMPKRDGFEFIAEVRKRGLLTPAAAVTAFARSQDRTRALLSGYQAYLTKPVEPAELLATVASLSGRIRP